MSVDALGVRAALPLGALLDAPPRISFESRRSRSTPSYMIPRATPHLQRPAARRRPDLHPRVHVSEFNPIQPTPIGSDGHAPRRRTNGRRRSSTRYGVIGIARLDGHGPPLHSVQQRSGSGRDGPEVARRQDAHANPIRLPQQSQLQRSRRRRPPVLRPRVTPRVLRDPSSLLVDGRSVMPVWKSTFKRPSIRGLSRTE